MKKEEISEIMYKLWMGVDQADFDMPLKDLMRSAPISAQKEFMKVLLESDNRHENDIDEEVLIKAKKIVGYEIDA